MDRHEKEYQDACVEELRPLVGNCITNVIKDDSGFFGLQLEDGTEMWINRDAEGNGPGFAEIVRSK